jgi:hypothetical protein
VLREGRRYGTLQEEAWQTGYENIAPRGPRKRGKFVWADSGKDVHKRQRMGRGLADRSIISRLSVKVRKAGAQMLAITTHSLERRKEKAKGGGGTASCAPVSISGALEACIDGMADVSGKWETGRDWRAR